MFGVQHSVPLCFYSEIPPHVNLFQQEANLMPFPPRAIKSPKLMINSTFFQCIPDNGLTPALSSSSSSSSPSSSCFPYTRPLRRLASGFSELGLSASVAADSAAAAAARFRAEIEHSP